MDKSCNKKNRSKVSHACEYCRKRRIKCSGTKPKCENCYKLNINCIYLPVIKKRGPKIGYIEKILNDEIPKKIDELITKNLISDKDIVLLAKNNESLFNNNILKKYINNKNENQDELIQQNVKPINLKVLKENIKSRLLILKKEDVIIFKNSEKTKVGTAIIYNNSEILKYHYIEIDIELIKLYFRYAHVYIPILDKTIFMQHVRNKTILPALLLAVYTAAYLFKPKPDIKQAMRYYKMAYYSIIEFNFGIDYQLIQTYTIISNCLPGTNTGWIIIGNALRLSYILHLYKENKSLNKLYNNERKITFWYNISMDILYSIMTGRSYRYDYYNMLDSEYIISFLSQLEITKNALTLVKTLILSKIFHNIILYIREIRLNNIKTNDLYEKIEHWLEILEPEFNYNYNAEDEDIYDIVTNSQFDIFFTFLKILFYRRKSTLITKKFDQKLPDENDLNVYGDIGYNFIKYKGNELKFSDYLLRYCFDFLKKKHEIRSNDKKFTFYEDNSKLDLSNEYDTFTAKEKIQHIPEFFIYNNFLYIKFNKFKLAKIDYNLKNAYKNFEEDNQSSHSNSLVNDNNNLKRTYNQTNSNDSNKDIDAKRYKILDSYFNKNENEKSESNNDVNQKFSDKLLNNIYNKLSNNTRSINNNEYEKIYDNQIYLNHDLTNLNNDYNINDFNKDNSFLDHHDNKLDFSQFFILNDNDDNNNYYISSDEDISSSNQFYEMENEHDNMEESNNDNIFNPCNDKIHINYDIIQRYIKLDEESETESIQDNSVTLLKECYYLSKIVHKKIKKLLQYLNNKNMIMNYLTVCCFYEIGIIYMLFYVNEGNEEDYQTAKYYESLLDEYSKFYLAINPYLKNYREMLKEAENSVQNNTKQFVIKDFF
ncbi:hypothetical protein BCR32DRAFT_289236 [Anaeromyces robustus]|uniref:Zn(2)-C6 fungal-type domain-containing protein n=1 Tax=Anaeromyces robustus TaxID=1754192 RepID=A0A1Y1XQI1_9FUNG|nr:hypothetical protein BCR32DRAFT_289236 [Anaeromyces robustus]|eukprot:ORX87584.1 hypothetical protein BCR32DRAFT_289236 [Anaeromyces robustus]